MKTSYLLIFLFLFSGSFFLGAQNKNQIASRTQTTEKKILYYSFSGPTSVTELESLKNEILLLEGVKEIKAECKSEKKSAQFRIIYYEKKRTTEGDKEFDITAVKKLILKYQYTPGDSKIENVE